MYIKIGKQCAVVIRISKNFHSRLRENMFILILWFIASDTCKTSQKQGSRSVLSYLSLSYIPSQLLDSSANLNLSNCSISGHQASRATKPMRWGYLGCVPKVTCEKLLITNTATKDRTRVACIVTPTLYHVAIKNRLARQGSTVYHIPIFFYLCWGFTAQSTQWAHVKRGQFT